MIFLKEIFGLPCTTTAVKEAKTSKCYGGISASAISNSAIRYDKNLVIESSDEARIKRFVFNMTGLYNNEYK